MKKSEIRKDYIQDKYVIIAPMRNKRPHDIERQHIKKITREVCSFCPKNIDHQNTILTIGTEKDWQIKVIANKYPAVTLDNPKAYGTQEVVVETPEHVPEMEDLSVDHIATILEVYAMRTKVISENKKNEVGRNDPCPCGSGKKYKRCHGA